jgi:hypothetical protein
MVKIGKWNDRKFNFDYPVDVHPVMLARLRGTPVRVEEILTDLPNDILTKEVDGTWSIQQNAAHLIDVDVLHLCRMDDYDNNLDELRPADLSVLDNYIPTFDRNSRADILKTFRSIRTDLYGKLAELDEAGASRTAHHPRLDQPMRVVDMSLFAAEHDDYHVARMYELLELLGK